MTEETFLETVDIERQDAQGRPYTLCVFVMVGLGKGGMWCWSFATRRRYSVQISTAAQCLPN